MQYKAAYFKTFFDNMILPYVVPEGMKISEGTWYLINTKFGEDLGLAYSGVKELTGERFLLKKPSAEQVDEADIDDIEIDDASILEAKKEHITEEIDNSQIESLKAVRGITGQELADWQFLQKDGGRAYQSALKEIRDLNLDMKLINVHFLFQKKKVIFNFTADNRVDFRQLVKRLAGIFKTRIEMRQIGVRDAAKVEGGYGVCGLITCCRRSNCHINSIYLKMAKDQGFVVNSSKLTGICGRLMCCLSYEMEFYSTELKHFPESGALVTDGAKSFTVASVNVLTRDVYIADEFHHQKKVAREALHFVKKDHSGKSVYRLRTEQQEGQDNQ